MTRDYKNVTETSVKTKKSRAKSKSDPKSSNVLPGWVWLVSGVVIGGFVSFIVYLKLSVPLESDAVQVEPDKKTVVKSTDERSNTQSEKKPEKDQFEFYKILPNREVTLPESEQAPGEQNVTTTEKSAAEKNTTEKKLETRQEQKTDLKTSVPAVSKTQSYVYTLQVGSFLNFKDADKHKANLGMLGIGSKIHAIKTRNVTRYRVLVGPYENIKRINEIDAVMKSNNIKTLLLKERG